MLPDFSLRRSSKAWRVTFLIASLLVFSYLFFEVLDLDGSSFPFRQFSLDRSIIVAEVVNESEAASWAGKILPRADVALLALPVVLDAIREHAVRAARLSGLHAARSHGYRMALPRSSPSDPLQPL